jgi:hypothetical protein
LSARQAPLPVESRIKRSYEGQIQHTGCDGQFDNRKGFSLLTCNEAKRLQILRAILPQQCLYTSPAGFNCRI